MRTVTAQVRVERQHAGEWFDYVVEVHATVELGGAVSVDGVKVLEREERSPEFDQLTNRELHQVTDALVHEGAHL